MDTQRHIAEVTARIVAIAPPDLRDGLVRAAASHEEGRVPGFGELWQPDLDAAACAERHGDRLRALLLFELAHEGAATDAMRAVAAAGGVADEFAGWERALETGAG